jgi:hypothetical protein
VAVLAIACAGFGIGWWVHPGAGLALAALLVVIDLWPSRRSSTP